MRVVAEKATRRESPLISISHSWSPVSTYKISIVSSLRGSVWLSLAKIVDRSAKTEPASGPNGTPVIGPGESTD